jgi:hypothetical protein
MDWNFAIEKNRQALKRVLAALVAMAGLGQSAIGSGQSGVVGPSITGPSPAPDCRLPAADCPLPRHLYRAVLALLRPAEAAARRLIIVAARSLVVPPPALRRPREPEAKPTIPLNRLGLAMLVPPGLLPKAGPYRPAPRALALPLFDRLPHWGGHRRPVARSVPRISVAGSERLPLPNRRPPSRDDQIDARRLLLRFAALGRVLDDLPAQARRFARWSACAEAHLKESRDAINAGKPYRPRRFHRIWPLKPGRPPGWRKKPTHEVHEILDVTHGLAIWAMERPKPS